MATHPNEQPAISVSALRPSTTVPREGKWRTAAIDATQDKLDRKARQDYLAVCERARRDGVVGTMDASGRVLQLPEDAIIMDCCNCKRAMCRNMKSLPLWARDRVEQYGGSQSDGTGHLRPYCRECYD